ncbi:MAG TPA: alpha/beta hydrolase [Chloroflexota bacterium]|nr:alpha/beta hydrolase [Chloroflexota bacterium]
MAYGYRDRWIDLPGGALHAVEWGEAGPLVLLTHGITAQAHVWDPIAARLAARYRVLSLDQRGHGESLRPPSGYSLADHVADLAAVLDALGGERAVVVGHSLGARNVFAFAALHPARTALLVAIDYGPWIAAEAFTALDARVLGAPSRFASYAEARAYLATRYPQITPDALERRARFGLRPVPDGLVWRYEPAAIAQTLEHLNADLAPLVPRVQAPTLIVRGERSAFYDAAAFARLREARPDFEYVEIAGATHYVPEERPDTVYHLLAAFLERHAAALAGGLARG